MIVIGTDTHKATHTCGAVFAGTGQLAGELTAGAREPGFRELLAWGQNLDEERIWAIEDCRHVSGSLERFLAASGERVIRVPPKLMGESRRAERTRGKSDPIDALAIARAALREGPETLPAAHLDKEVWLDRVARKLSRAEQGARVRVSRELVGAIRDRTRRAAELEREIGILVRSQAPQLLELPGCGVLSAAKLLAETAGARRFATDAKLTQGRIHPPARDYLARKQAEGKSRIEAIRCLKRHLARRVWKLLVNLEIDRSMTTVDTQRGSLAPQIAVAA